MEFGITEDAETRFKMKQGLWAMVDSGYADSSNLLEGHTVDLRGETFRLFDKAKKPVDANYLMSDIKIANAPTRA